MSRKCSVFNFCDDDHGGFRACQKNVRFMFFLQLSLTRGLSHDIFDDLVVVNDHWGCVEGF